MYCVTAVYSPHALSINYTLVHSQGGTGVGWWGFAQGTQMKGANMAVSGGLGKTAADGTLAQSLRDPSPH
jgi:hypothetical protein